LRAGVRAASAAWTSVSVIFPRPTSRRTPDRHERSLPPDPHGMDRAHRRALPGHRPEGSEVVPADEGLSGSRHRVDVQRVPHPERLALAKRTARPVPDGVAVFPIPRRSARVEARCDRSNIADRDVRRQLAVDRRLEAPGVHPVRKGECDHLSEGVDPGVRAAGPVDRVTHLVVEVGQRGLELSLDCPDTRSLDLEAGKVRAVIFDGGAEAPRGRLSPA
jgi:hypothetical protein